MSQKHDANPSAGRKHSRYRKTVDLGSASGWDILDLKLFHVDFTPDRYSDLMEVVGNRFYEIDPSDDIDRSNY